MSVAVGVDVCVLWQFSSVPATGPGATRGAAGMFPPQTAASCCDEGVLCEETESDHRFGDIEPEIQPSVCLIKYKASFYHVLFSVVDVSVPEDDLQWAPLPSLLARGSLSEDGHKETLERDIVCTVVCCFMFPLICVRINISNSCER